MISPYSVGTQVPRPVAIEINVSSADLGRVTFVQAYVLVNCRAGKSWKIAETARDIQNVKMAHAVTGQYDVVAYIEFATMDELTEILGNFQTMEGVEQTHTAVAIPPKLK